MSTEYGQRLRQAMARAGIKAQQLGDAIGTSRGSTGLVTLQRDEYRAIYVIVGRIGFRRLLSK